MFMHRAVIGLLAVLWVTSAGAAGPCDRRFPPDGSEEKFTLRQNGTRCEGFYDSPVAAEGIAVVSVTEGKIEFNMKQGEVLFISPAEPRSSPVHVIGVALPIKTYYRLEADLPAGGSLRWPLDEVVRPRGLRPEWIGMVGKLEGAADTSYVPLRVSRESARAASSPVQITLRTTVELEQLMWRLRPVVAGACKTLQPEAQKKSWKRHRARTIEDGGTVTLPLPKGVGEQCVDVRAKVRDRAEWLTLSFRITSST